MKFAMENQLILSFDDFEFIGINLSLFFYLIFG